MRALTYGGPHRPEVRNKPDPRIEHPQDGIVRVTAAATNAPGTQHGRRFGRSPLDAVDLDPAQRPGVPQERRPEPWPNSRVPPQRMQVPPSVPMHGRPNKRMPPVYGTAVPLRGVSGLVRKAAYRYPDHVATHWLLLLLGDRIDSWGTRAGRVAKVVAPLAVALVAANALGLLPRRDG